MARRREQAALLLEAVELQMVGQAVRGRQRQRVLGPDGLAERAVLAMTAASRTMGEGCGVCGVRGEGEGWVEGRGGCRGQWGGEAGGQPAIDTGARARPREEARPVVHALAIPAALPRLGAPEAHGNHHVL